MLSWTMMFLIFALIAGVLGFTGLAGGASQIAWILFVVFLIGSAISLLAGRRGSVVQHELWTKIYNHEAKVTVKKLAAVALEATLIIGGAFLVTGCERQGPTARRKTRREMIAEADANLLIVIKELRGVRAATGQDDPGTADLFPKAVQSHEKHEWQLRDILKKRDGLAV